MLSIELSALFARDLERLAQELRAFPDTPALWRTAPGITNAAGTLALHLEGNLRHFIGLRLGGLPYERNRPLEFSARDVLQPELVGRIQQVRDTIPPVLVSLTPERLDGPYPDPFNGETLTTRKVLLHLYGHLNYHLGQIDSLRRVTTGDGAIALASS
jgi:hypothetical protein